MTKCLLLMVFFSSIILLISKHHNKRYIFFKNCTIYSVYVHSSRDGLTVIDGKMKFNKIGYTGYANYVGIMNTSNSEGSEMKSFVISKSYMLKEKIKGNYIETKTAIIANDIVNSDKTNNIINPLNPAPTPGRKVMSVLYKTPEGLIISGSDGHPATLCY